AGSEPHADAIRANADDDEEIVGRRHDEDDALHEGHDARHEVVEGFKIRCAVVFAAGDAHRTKVRLRFSATNTIRSL
ncbi:hypothetical protein, partial [Janthinobacterium sp.]|uniref:hypothetical protein n=1 Tax=Janthinobacterium sp. TaxID=1871054 RepID=UPI002585F5E8